MISSNDRGGDSLVTIAEACDRLGLRRTKVSELLLRGAIDSAKIDGRRLVSSASLDRFIRDSIAANAAALQR